MDKVYTVIFSETYGGYEFIGAYATKDKAELAIENCMKEYHGSDYTNTTWEREIEGREGETERIEDEYILTECELNKNVHQLIY
ncbi:DUF7336 domain-containing protein [Mammaliicoccus lentus]|uniref:DUF7336 domain-containing protein n=1 Tax=Mammaliicoccus lentus TaxID=42858 RepID=UPI001071D4FC|nr:hypothetical protein [Mammaliicoccus lentus]MBF0795195.1 hypothetical protein [Mammaliicoccus lentus]TFV14596.1 hypothetical protein E4T78_11060 [Mammaliicoccus lentus]